MESPPKYGKITKDFFDRVIYPHLGARRSNIIAGPSMGLDNCVINVGGGQVLVATTDPLTYIMDIGPEDSAWLSVNAIASDIATSGFRPQYAIFDLNLPSSLSSEEFEKYWIALSSECERIGIAIIGGHTGRFEGLDSTIIGAGTMFSFGSSRSYLTTAGSSSGDNVILTKGVAIETTGVLARVFPAKVQEKIGKNLYERSLGYFKKITTVDDALTAAKVGIKSGGVCAMHDATEGGVLSALYELAMASSLGLRVKKENLFVSEETRMICSLFNIDPYITLSEGSLVLSCNPSKANDILTSLRLKGIEAAVVGELSKPEEGIMLVDESGSVSPIKYPVEDPYWKAFYAAKKSKWV